MKRIGYIAAQRLKSLKGQNIEWNTEDDDKQIRLNCRDYTITSGEQHAVRSWPKISVGGTTALVAFDARPGIYDGIDGSHLIGFRSDLYFKGTSGTLSYIAAGFDGSITDENVKGRTFGGDLVVGARLWHQLRADHTYNAGVHLVGFLVRNHGGGKAWDALLKFEGDEAGVWKKTDTPSVAAGYIKVLFGASDERWIQLYSTGP